MSCRMPHAVPFSFLGSPFHKCSLWPAAISLPLGGGLGLVLRGGLLLAELSGTIVVAKVDRFFSLASSAEEIIAQAMCYQPLHASTFSDWNTSSPQLQFIDAESFKANLTWMQRRPGVIRVILPSAIMLK